MRYELEDCATEGLDARIIPRKKTSWAGAIVFWIVVAILAVAIVGLGFAPAKAEAQAFKPVNDSLSIIVEVRNIEADSVQILLGYQGVIDTIGWVRGGSRRIFTFPSATLGNVPHVVVGARNVLGELRRVPLVVPRGAWCLLLIGTPRPGANA